MPSMAGTQHNNAPVMTRGDVPLLDPHIHLIALDKGRYHWLSPHAPPWWPKKALIHRSFTEKDLVLPQGVSLEGFVHIEAGFDNEAPWRELRWLEATCTLPFRSVAYVDLGPDFFHHLRHLQRFRSLCGVRHILGKDASNLLNHKNVQEKLSVLASLELSFDAEFCVGDTSATEALCALLEKLPPLKVILTHLGFPSYAQDNRTWQRNLARLAHFPHCAIKASGWEMTHPTPDPQWILQKIEQAIEVMGPHRVMLASNFPVCLLSQSYERYWTQMLHRWGQDSRLIYDNTATWYKLVTRPTPPQPK